MARVHQGSIDRPLLHILFITDLTLFIIALFTKLMTTVYIIKEKILSSKINSGKDFRPVTDWFSMKIL